MIGTIAICVVALAVLGTIGGLVAWGVGAERRAAAAQAARIEADGRVAAATVQVDLAKHALDVAIADGDRQEQRADFLDEEIDALETADPADVVPGRPGRSRLRQYLRTTAARSPSGPGGPGVGQALPVAAAPAGPAAGAGDGPVSRPGDT